MSKRWESESGEKKLPSYEPMHGSKDPGKVTKTMGDSVEMDSWAPGWGGTDGVQTEGSMDEAMELLDYDMDSKETEIGNDGMNVRSPGMRARYTKEFNRA